MRNVNLNFSIHSKSNIFNSTKIYSKTSSKDAASNYYYNMEKQLSIIPVVLMMAGTLGNMLALYVLTRKKLRIQSTMLYFASLTVLDTLSLYSW